MYQPTCYIQVNGQKFTFDQVAEALGMPKGADSFALCQDIPDGVLMASVTEDAPGLGLPASMGVVYFSNNDPDRPHLVAKVQQFKDKPLTAMLCDGCSAEPLAFFDSSDMGPNGTSIHVTQFVDHVKFGTIMEVEVPD